MNQSQRIAVITGATSGIGLATAQAFAAQGINLILCGRRANRLQSIKQELSQQVQVQTLCFDVRDRAEVTKAFESLPEAWQNIDILINNAGNAHGLSPIQDGDLDDWDAMLDINVRGLLYVSKSIIPTMVNRQSGHIVNIGSIAGRAAYPNGNVYCASKSAVASLTEGMRQDLNPYGIKVTAIDPGMVETEFSLVRFKGDEARADAVYKGLTPLSAADVADAILYAVTRPAHVVVADMLLLPTAQASATIVKRQ
ncbi:NADP-dependent 3-hydroxy acid dehydrogenase YdfG [Flexibacter flexilis DSM 6793]|uniref:NADP-dependent 3-hydroxy acid dehydrogenase YdfG n=1 Tax=Flexibacter flexilis DSM 6793 TaxID=927664 RepID=A0A1I1J5C2_9BACT|nr:SDR family NAD(P)-dependent oxidoreductase [Flexibacter flexilis]SFC43192.1 NADP-dependent 3-hydroxy acid dehydrogenase YdfG [Flexibacter flexilis DSM 6793]